MALYNAIYQAGAFPERWAIGIIVPIYKKGDSKLASNYRGITLTSCMSKLFTYILNTRLCSWLEEEAKLSNTQFAYRKGYGTVDAVFVLNYIISKTLRSGLFCAFIDFTKAYDLIDRHILYTKLMGYGISKQLLKIIMNMYASVKCKVRTSEGEISEEINVDRGLMQGECLSSTLFSLFLNDIDICMNNVPEMGHMLDEQKITVLKYADDLILISNTHQGLQNGLNTLSEYCKLNKLTVNVAKSKVMFFCSNKVKRDELLPLQFNQIQLHYVNSFKYLGITFHQSPPLKFLISTLCEQARKAQIVLDLHLKRHSSLSLEHSIMLFDTFIKPILKYNCEVWGYSTCELIDKYVLSFLRNHLRVKGTTNSSMVYMETGYYPISLEIKKCMLKYWIKLISSEENSLLYSTYKDMTDTHLKNRWLHTIKKLLNQNGFGHVWQNQYIDNEKQFLMLFESRCKDIFAQECFTDIQSSNRCRLYREIKESYNMADYLRYNISATLRSSLTKIRLSSHRFMVERGRWAKPKIQYVDRKCTLCTSNDIQDEYHMLIQCPQFKDEREKYIKRYYYVRPSMYKFVQLVNSSNKKERFRFMIFLKLVIGKYNELTK